MTEDKEKFNELTKKKKIHNIVSSFDKLQQLAMLYLNQEARQGLATEHKDYIKYMRKE